MHNTSIGSHLTIVPAGAGSGKTYFLQNELARRIENGLAPEKIVAVTFTESAAAELRSRIRAALIGRNLLEQAQKLDQAYITTIHGFGLRLITEFAFDGGMSPSPRMLNDDEQGMLVSRALAHSDDASALMENLDQYGYRYNFSNNATAEESFRGRMLSFIGTLRGIGRTGTAADLIAPAEDAIRRLYGDIRSAEHLKAVLLSAVEALLREFPKDLSPDYSAVKSVREELRANFHQLRRASGGRALETDWKLWKSLRKLRVSNRNTKLPAGYDGLAEEVMAAAHALHLHPGPLQDALNHATALIQSASACLNRYGEEKQQRGLVDFTDMLSLAHGLLCTNQAVAEAFRERVDCLVVDEFQDTNPLQFSLLWSLTRKGVETIIVGDLKQAIMGFQGADPRLMQELVNRHPSATRPQTGNYRSSRQLMHWINLVGTGLFDDYTPLTAEADYTSTVDPPLDVIRTGDKTLSESIWASHTTAHLTGLLDRGIEIFDRHRKEHRRLRGGDIAIICPTNKRLQTYASALRDAGIRCKIAQEGWHESRIVQLGCNALSFVADPGDRHAALYLAVTELGSHTLKSALAELMDHDKICDPVLEKLCAVAKGRQDRHVEDLLVDIIAALDLYGTITRWPDAGQARANLLRLEEECREFRNANRDAMACGGYYGSDVKTFLAWLKGRIERENTQPEATVIDEDAVVLTTWHKSKGQEWPIVAVCGMDRSYHPRLPETRVVYNDFSELDALLDSARIEIHPAFDAPETCDAFRANLLEGARNTATRLLYVALTRAREKVILEWPEYKRGKAGDSYWDLLVSSAGLDLEKDMMRFAGDAVTCSITTVGPEAAEIEGTRTGTALPTYGRVAIVPREMPENLTPEATTPSSLEGMPVSALPEVRLVRYGSGLQCEFPGLGAASRGTLLHRCFELLSGHAERRNLLQDAVDMALTEEQITAISTVVAAFDAWLAQELAPVGLESEIPIMTLDENGTVVTGTADMFVETADGFWVIDHKSDQTDDFNNRFLHYLPQLRCYAAALGSAQSCKPVRGVAVNWISCGVISLAPLPECAIG